MNLDVWFNAVYVRGKYTCSDFSADVIQFLTGRDIRPGLEGLLEAHDGRGLRRDHVRAFPRLLGPESPCLCVMQRPGFPVHLGVYVRGKVIQLTEHGVSFQPVEVATQFHKSYRFVKCIN